MSNDQRRNPDHVNMGHLRTVAGGGAESRAAAWVYGRLVAVERSGEGDIDVMIGPTDPTHAAASRSDVEVAEEILGDGRAHKAPAADFSLFSARP